MTTRQETIRNQTLVQISDETTCFVNDEEENRFDDAFSQANINPQKDKKYKKK